jgi:NDP-sugar pyrophosphorylase family protein
LSPSEAWPALVLTAGLGTRLRPLSLVRAKAALPVAGEVLVRRILRWLRTAGVSRVVVNLHHRAETITSRLGDGRDLGLEIRYSWEDPVLGSAGGPRRALSLLDADRFLIVNGDTLTDVDLAALGRAHERSGALVTMAVAAGDTTRYGGVLVDESGIVRGFARGGLPAARVAREAPDTLPYHFVGVQAADARAFAEAPDGEASETVRWLYPRLIDERLGSIRAHVSAAEFLDIGTPADYLATVATIAGREGRALDYGADVRVAPSANVQRSILWDRVQVNADATIVDCILADDVVIPEGASYERKAIAAIDGQLMISAI